MSPARYRWVAVAALVAGFGMLAPTNAFTGHAADAEDAGPTASLGIADGATFHPGETIAFSVGCYNFGAHVDGGVSLRLADPPYTQIAYGSTLDLYGSGYSGELVVPASAAEGNYTLVAGCYSLEFSAYDSVPVVVAGDPIVTTTTTTSPDQATDHISIGGVTEVVRGQEVAYSAQCSWMVGYRLRSMAIELRGPYDGTHPQYRSGIADGNPPDGRMQGTFDVPDDAPFGPMIIVVDCMTSFTGNPLNEEAAEFVIRDQAASTTSTVPGSSTTTSPSSTPTTSSPSATTTSTTPPLSASTTTSGGAVAGAGATTGSTAPPAVPVSGSPAFTG